MISNREKKKLANRQNILDAAALVFKNTGFSESSISDIMKAANLGVGTFYNYFDTKEQLLLALLKDLADKLESAVDDGINKKFSSLQLLNLACEIMAELLDENRFVLPLFLSASEHSDKPDQLPTRNFTPTFKPIFEMIITRGQKNLEIRNDVPSDLIAEMFHSIYQAASFSKLNISFKDNITLKVKILIDGIKKNNSEDSHEKL